MTPLAWEDAVLALTLAPAWIGVGWGIATWMQARRQWLEIQIRLANDSDRAAGRPHGPDGMDETGEAPWRATE